ncbi:MAG: hypothetical protein QXV12_00840 [Candidatus Rehaiarchaeum fermentans]|nr:hypothetical protein [Candidatus Rehaiarchaeum fermentans]
MKNKLGEDIRPTSIVYFILFVSVLIFGLISVFILHSRILAFITLALFFILFIISLIFQYKDVKSGVYQRRMEKLWQNTLDKYKKK